MNLQLVPLFLLLIVLIQSRPQDHPSTPDFKSGGLVWPQPATIIQTNNVFTINPSTFNFTLAGQNSSLLQRALQRYQKLCFPITTNPIYPWELANQTLKVSVLEASETDQIQFGVDESYILEVTTSNWILTAANVFGAIRGLETFSQLITNNRSVYTILETKIVDSPRFPWRGLLIDTSRHWLPVESILDVIRAMSYSKLNTLHWHIVDGQSFPLESAVYPLLSLQGAYHPNQVFTQEDVVKIVSYANDHGVRVVPEFDMPAHSSSWGFGYDFMTIKCYSRRDDYDFNDGWGNNPMDPINPAVYVFIQNFLSEVATIFPDQWLHLGGDEINYNC
jgi:hexosaminidase